MEVFFPWEFKSPPDKMLGTTAVSSQVLQPNAPLQSSSVFMPPFEGKGQQSSHLVELWSSGHTQEGEQGAERGTRTWESG